MNNPDFLIIGAGIVGMTIAREIKLRSPSANVLVLEKEPAPGLHSSGRNSGVLHSGIYYPPKSLKATTCAQGSQEMADYCQEHKLPLLCLGKVLVATSSQDQPQVDLLAERAQANGVKAELLGEKDLAEIEPEARSATGTGLLVPCTSVGSPKAVMNTLNQEVTNLGAQLRFSTTSFQADEKSIKIRFKSGEQISYGHVINAAGLHADKVAHLFGAGQRYTLLPFKGIYWKLDPGSNISINHLVYPVPDLRVPFLGVHSTTATDGSVYLGPTAVPALGRENYQGTAGISISEFSRITGLLAQQLYYNHNGFRRLAWQEGRRFFRHWFAEAARAILPGVRAEHLIPSNKVGIRAQMVDKSSKRLVNDFLIESGPYSTHVLNAISPAWTCSFPFARMIVEKYLKL